MVRISRRSAGVPIGDKNAAGEIRIKVLHVVGALIAGGAERFVASMCCELSKIGLNVRLFVMSNREDEASSDLRRALDTANVNVIYSTEALVSANCVLQYAKALNEFDPDIVHLHTPNTELLHFLSLVGRRVYPKLTRTIHSTKRPPKLIQRIATWLNRAAVEIACSNAVASTRSVRSNNSSIVVPNGTRFDWEIANADVQVAMRRLLGLKLDKYIFVNVGRMGGGTIHTSPKAHNVLIDAWKKANALCSVIELHLLGDGELASALKAQVNAIDNVFFHGVVARPEQWLLAANCFVLPSRYEGMPIAAIEAIGTGLPCIFSDIPPLKELSPSKCTWVPVDDVAQLSAALLAETQDGQSPLIEETERFRETYGIAQAASKYRDCYSKMMSIQ